MYFLRSFWCSVFIVFTFVLVCNAYLRTFYFSDLCPLGDRTYNATISLGGTYSDYNSSAILKARNFGSYPRNQICNVAVQPPYGHGVVVAIRTLDLRLGCTDNLTLINTSGGNKFFCWDKHDTRESESFFSKGKMSIIFKTAAGGSTLFMNGFQLTVTTFRSPPCYSFNFQCWNYKCIAKELTCDGHNHCGDMSDQSKCGVKSVGGIVGIVFGCVFVMIAVIAGLVYCRSRRNRRIVTTTIHSPPPHQVNQPYGSASPPPGSYMPPPPQYSPASHPQESVNPLYR